jgi:hypothetical protein
MILTSYINLTYRFAVISKGVECGSWRDMKDESLCRFGPEKNVKEFWELLMRKPKSLE